MADVDDIGTEWADRYGPLPVAAVGLLALARLRASALARGIREVAMSSVRAAGGRPPTVRSPRCRCRRAHRCGSGAWSRATYREDQAQLLVPITNGDSAPDTVRGLIEELIPLADVSPGGDTL